MEVIKIKCLNCNEITSVLRELMIPYEGKVISVKCTNPQCKMPMKVQVPLLSSLNEKLVATNFDVPPTQIMNKQQNSAASIKLKVQSNDKTEEQIFHLKEGKNTIGRLSMNRPDSIPDIPIVTSDRKISRNYHCSLFLQQKEGGFEVLLKDNKSANGTFLDNSNKPLDSEDQIFLKDKDVFVIGDTRIQLEFN
jgi:hypothetical protein